MFKRNDPFRGENPSTSGLLSYGIAVLVLMASLIVTSAALAQSPKYSYVQTGYSRFDSGLSIFKPGDGWLVGASYGVKIFHVLGEYSSGNFDDNLNDLFADLTIDTSQWRVAVGGHGGLGERADLVGHAGYVHDAVEAEITISDPQYFRAPRTFREKASEKGYFGTFGIRWLPAKFLEFNAFASHVDFGDIGGQSTDDQIFDVALIGFIKKFGIGLEYSTPNDADGDSWNLFVRYNWGKG